MTRLVETITTTTPVETADLITTLESVLSTHYGVARRVIELARRPSPYSSSYALEELEATLDDGASLQIMFKNLAWDSMLDGARQAKPAFLYNPLREIETYRSVLASRQTGAPVCFGAVVDASRARFWLFLEKVSGSKMRHVGEFATWREVAQWLALLHTEFGGEAGALRERATAHLLRYDGDFFRLWIGRARLFFRRSGAAHSSRNGRHIERLAAVYERLVVRLASLPVTLVHGDFFASNVLTQETADGLRVCPVDWEMAGIGPGLIDLAALTSGTWSDEERTEIAMSYYEALKPNGTRPSSTDEFFTLLECCHLHLAVQWLGWSENWSPPSDEAQDWLGVALRLAERLRL
jgi:hypothetical protein